MSSITVWNGHCNSHLSLRSFKPKSILVIGIPVNEGSEDFINIRAHWEHKMIVSHYRLGVCWRSFMEYPSLNVAKADIPWLLACHPGRWITITAPPFLPEHPWGIFITVKGSPVSHKHGCRRGVSCVCEREGQGFGVGGLIRITMGVGQERNKERGKKKLPSLQGWAVLICFNKLNWFLCPLVPFASHPFRTRHLSHPPPPPPLPFTSRVEGKTTSMGMHWFSRTPDAWKA